MSVHDCRAPVPKLHVWLAGLLTLPLAVLFPIIAIAALNALVGVECLRFRGAWHRAYFVTGLILCAISLVQFAVCFAHLSPFVPWAPFDW